MEATNERPWLWVLFVIVVILPFVLIAVCCFPGSKVHGVNETCKVLVYSCFVTIKCALDKLLCCSVLILYVYLFCCPKCYIYTVSTFLCHNIQY